MPKKYEISFLESIKLATKGLKGFAKRQYVAQMAIKYFDSSPRKMETHVGVKRKMVALSIKEYESGFRCVENFSLRGRKKRGY
jgi:hypothetical protein